jgi:hypothetical protein
MVILKPSEATHSITIIARKNASAISIVIKNESKNTTETIEDISTTFVNGYLTFEITKTVLEQESFEYSVYNFSDSELLFRGKAFATNQTDLQNYKIN